MNNFRLMWCFKHGEVAVDDMHYKQCSGPYASCPPPELHPLWYYDLDEPFDEEILIMNINAEESMLDVM